MGWRGREAFGQWPGRGPFSHLPPWHRPGWLYGPGSCWRLFGPGSQPFYQQSPPKAADQIKNLKGYKKELEAELSEISREIERLKKETKKKTEEEMK